MGESCNCIYYVFVKLILFLVIKYQIVLFILKHMFEW